MAAGQRLKALWQINSKLTQTAHCIVQPLWLQMLLVAQVSWYPQIMKIHNLLMIWFKTGVTFSHTLKQRPNIASIFFYKVITFHGVLLSVASTLLCIIMSVTSTSDFTFWMIRFVSANLSFSLRLVSYFSSESVLCICKELACVVKLLIRWGTDTQVRSFQAQWQSMLVYLSAPVHGMCHLSSSGDREYTILPHNVTPCCSKDCRPRT